MHRVQVQFLIPKIIFQSWYKEICKYLIQNILLNNLIEYFLFSERQKSIFVYQFCSWFDFKRSRLCVHIYFLVGTRKWRSAVRCARPTTAAWCAWTSKSSKQSFKDLRDFFFVFKDQDSNILVQSSNLNKCISTT